MRLCLLFFCLLTSTLLQGRSPSPERVLVVANANDRASMRIAQHYLEARQIPEANLYTVETSLDNDIDWETFVRTIYNPLKQQLIEDGWLDIAGSGDLDSEGRLGGLCLGHRIDFLVTCNLPLRITPSVPFEGQVKGAPDTDAAAVDSELTLLPQADWPRKGPARNPLFGQAEPSQLALEEVVRVSRLDGPSMQATLALVDNALRGEREGLIGRAYIDLKGPVPQGDTWIEACGELARQMGYPVHYERQRSLFQTGDRFDAPALYFGWYHFRTQGLMADPQTQLVPGAIAFHLHSYSALDFSKSIQWAPALVAKGAGFTVGNVFEPYLGSTHRPQLLLAALANGQTAGEAAYFALPALSWMCIAVGDPLYRPFGAGTRFLARLDDPELPLEMAGHLIVQEISRRQLSGDTDNLWDWAKARFYDFPARTLAFELATMAIERGEPAATLRLLAMPFEQPPETAQHMGLSYQMAQLLLDQGLSAEALQILQQMLPGEDWPAPRRKALLAHGIQAARAENAFELAADWQALLDELNAPAQ